MDEVQTSPKLFDEQSTSGIESGDEVLDRARSTLRALESELGEVQSAIARLEQGSYAKCEMCGAAIEEHRLVQDPTVRYCAAHHLTGQPSPL